MLASSPTAATRPEPHAPQLTLVAPALPRRMSCWVYEGLLLFGVVFISGYLFTTLSQTRHALDNRHAQQAFLFVIFGIYFTWFWARGQTLAMKTWGIRIVDLAGRPISQRRALLRYLLAWVWFLPSLGLAALLDAQPGASAVLVIGWVLVWVILSRFHAQRQFWHDVWAGTRLIGSGNAGV